MKVKFKKLHPEAQIPQRVHASDAGLDLVATSKVRKYNIISYGTGLAIDIPNGYVGLLFQRSSVYKKDLILTNCVGVLDSGYQGEIIFNFRKTFIDARIYEIGDRIGQLVILKLPEIELEEVDSFDESDRGTDGFGSTGS